MSLVPKMCEVSEFILRNQVNYAFITETWLRSSVVDSVYIDIPGYSVLRRDRQSDHHGGTCLYVKDVSYQKLDELSCCPEHEILWVQLRPRRLPRGFSSLIVAVVYYTQLCEDVCFNLSYSLSLVTQMAPWFWQEILTVLTWNRFKDIFDSSKWWKCLQERTQF